VEVPTPTSMAVDVIQSKPLTSPEVATETDASKVILPKLVAPKVIGPKPTATSSIDIEKYPPQFNHPFNRRQNKRSRWAERRLKWLRKAKPCGLCDETSKYRCPKCHSFHYCSVKCWKDHIKECKEMKRRKVESTFPMILPKLALDPAHAKLVSRHQLYLLERSNPVRRTMTPEIKDMVLQVALAKEPLKTLERCLETNPKFSRFAELILAVID